MISLSIISSAVIDIYVTIHSVHFLSYKKYFDEHLCDKNISADAQNMSTFWLL